MPAKTFEYTTTAEPKPLRAVLEIGAVLTLGFTWYATTAPTVHDWDPGYRWSIFRSKLTLQKLGPDANSFGTNFVGHPLGGTGYYLAARSNRLTILESFALSCAGSLFWELFGEVSEVVSLNDMIVTPLAGLSIGEATTQLGAYFDRQEATSTHRFLGTAFGPFKTLNDALDRLEPSRARPDEWQRFDARFGASLTREDVASASTLKWWPAGRFALSSRLVRLPGYDRAGRGGLWFDDGNASSLELDGAFDAAGLNDLDFATEVVIAGGYYRARWRDADGAAWGGNGLVGVTSGFVYGLHQYRRREGRAIDRMASVRPFGVAFQQRGALGGPIVSSELGLGPLFGGVTPNAKASYRGALARLPAVENIRGYYFGLGGYLRAKLAVEDGPLRAAAELRGEGYRDVRGPHDERGAALSDLSVRYGLSVSYRDPHAGVTPGVFVERRERVGWIEGARERLGEVTLGADVGAEF